jgi:2',3'-cyclic-nucleotide 2'-phosphodiesterase (5'-nucleotidase family)
MLKTTNFHFAARVSQLFLSLCLLAAVASGVFAQADAAKPAPSQSPVRSKASQTVIDPSLPDDPAVIKMLEPYAGKVRALDVVIGKLEGELRKGGLGAGTLGNFVTDGMRARARAQLGVPIDVTISNSGGLRKNAISPGDLRVRDIFELLPFENALVELELTGDQLLKTLQVCVESSEPQSGARLKYRTTADKKNELIEAVLIDADGREKAIDPGAMYRVITIDYLLSVKGGNFAILQESKVKKPLGVTIRDAMIEYVKAETTAGRTIKAKLDGRFRREGANEAQEKDPQ